VLPFRVGISPDVRGRDGRLLFDFGALDEIPGVEWEVFETESRELGPEVGARYDALVLATAIFHVDRRTLADADRLTLIARLGVGYDRIDLPACTEAGILLTVAPDAVRRPMATAAIGFLLSLTLKLQEKDRVIREDRWADEIDHLGVGLVGRTLGMVGLGNIGREVLTLAEPFSMRHIAHDPYVDPARVPKRLRTELVPLDDLLAQSDFVCVTCPLTPETRHLLDERRLGLLKPSAFLINIARGPIVDQDALVRVLTERRIAGAALDVFDPEPLPSGHPLTKLDNVMLTPHSAGRTDERFTNGARTAVAVVGAVSRGRRPPYVVDPTVLANPRLRGKLREYRRRSRVPSGTR
jgi:phosphoglycerate dehydrogenase-like enzyme